MSHPSLPPHEALGIIQVMPQEPPIIPWKRYWSPLGKEITSFSDDGFFPDPDHSFGRHLNPAVLSTEQVLDRPCVVLCGQPGIGKTTVLLSARTAIESRPGADPRPLWISLRDIPSVEIFHRKAFETDKWRAWLNQADARLTMVVDAIDEGLLRVPNFISYLTAELKEAPVDRLRLILVCRTAEWSLAEGGQLIGLWLTEKAEAVFELCPLRQQDARLAAQAWQVDADQFVSEVHAQHVTGLAARPTTLFFLLGEFKAQGTFPGTHAALYQAGCRRLCEEPDPARIAAARFREGAVPFSPSDLHRMAARLAVMVMVCGKSAIKVSGTDLDPSDLRLDDISETASDQRLILAALSTALFTGRGQERFGFTHQTFSECMAANGLLELSLIQVRALLCRKDGNLEHVVPQLAETAAWLAAMSEDFFHHVMAIEPEVLLRSDVSAIKAEHKEALVRALLERAKNEETFDDVAVRRFYAGLNHPGLAKQIWPYVSDCTLNQVVRRMGIEIAGDCKVSDLMTDFLKLLGIESDVSIRGYLAHALEKLTPPDRASELIPLARSEVGPDPDDTIKGCALSVLVPEVWSAAEAAQFLTAPKNPSLFGAYHNFLEYELPTRLTPRDLTVLLSKLVEWELCFGSTNSLDGLANATMCLAMHNLRDPVVAEMTAEVWRQKTRSYLPFDQGNRPDFKKLLESDRTLARRLVEVILDSPNTTLEDAGHVVHGAEQWIAQGDLEWALQKIGDAPEARRAAWSRVIGDLVSPDAVKPCWDVFLDRIATIPELGQQCAWLRALDLDEREARSAKARWLRQKRLLARVQQNRPVPPDPEALIREDLRRIQDGDTASWTTLCEHLRLDGNGRLNFVVRHDLTESEGWKRADEPRRNSILEAARAFLVEYDDGYISSGSRTPYADPGYAAIWLSRERIQGDEEVKTAVRDRWLDAITGYRADYGEEAHQELIAVAFSLSPSRTTEGLLREIRRQDRELGSIRVILSYRRCWNDRLTEAVMILLRSGELKPGSIGAILFFLADVARTAAIDAIGFLLVSGGREDQRNTAIEVASVALGKLAEETWNLVWPLLESQPSLAKAVLAKLAYDLDRQVKKTFLPVVAEEHLADTYILTEQVFPAAEHRPNTEGEVAISRAVLHLKGELIAALTARGTDRACHQLMQLANLYPANRLWFRWRHNEALQAKRRKAWKPVAPEVVRQLLGNPRSRRIENESNLLEVLLESLDRFQTRLTKATPPDASVLWNYDGRGNNRSDFRPKDEEDFSDRIAAWLRDDLGPTSGVVIGREVQPRRGQKTDIIVSAISIVTGQDSSILTVVIEVKGCWNSGVRSAIKTQLVDDYLEKNAWTHGIYVVGWFPCDRWDGPSRGPKSYLDSTRFEDTAKEMDELSAPYDGVKSPFTVRAVCLDCRYPS